MKLRLRTILLLPAAIALMLSSCTIESNRVCIPDKEDFVLVYDLADVINEADEATLNQDLNDFKATTSNVIVVITHPDFCGEEPFMYATKAGEEMGVGTAENDNGIVLAIGTEVRKAFIAVGKGLEGAIPDAYAKRIVENEMIPEFKKDNYVGGIRNAVAVLKQLASGEITVYAGGKTTKSGKKSKQFPWGIIVMFLLFGGISLIGQIFRVRRYAKLNDITFWAAWTILSNSRRSHGGTFGHFTGGSGPFGGGGGGGGFGGFGGGSFGGGGAGGSW